MSKSIVEKLNLNKYKHVAVLGEPQGESLLTGLGDHHTALAGVGYDLIFAFVLDMTALQTIVKTVIDQDCLQPGGYLYAAYPKKGNKVYPTYIHRDDLFEGLGADEQGRVGTSSLKFSRMVGLNEVFTVVGFKNEAKGAKAASAKPSQRVDDYVAFIPQIEKDLEDRPKALEFYRSLTPGYRKDWARYVYGAVQQETQAKRKEEMKTVLEAGFKSVDSYRRR